MMQRDPSKRPSAKELLESTWLANPGGNQLKHARREFLVREKPVSDVVTCAALQFHNTSRDDAYHVHTFCDAGVREWR